MPSFPTSKASKVTLFNNIYQVWCLKVKRFLRYDERVVFTRHGNKVFLNLDSRANFFLAFENLMDALKK